MHTQGLTVKLRRIHVERIGTGGIFKREWHKTSFDWCTTEKILDEKVNAHLPYYSTLKSSGLFSSKTFQAGLLFFSGETEKSYTTKVLCC